MCRKEDRTMFHVTSFTDILEFNKPEEKVGISSIWTTDAPGVIAECDFDN